MRDLMQGLLRELRPQEKEMVRLLGEFVRCESPSGDKAAVDRFGRRVAAEWLRRGASVRILRQANRGDHVRTEIRGGDRNAQPKAGQITVLGHLDTVYPLGTLAQMPFRVSAGRAWGPGTFDMKAGLVIALFAVDALRALGIPLRKRIAFLWNSDEEIGSETSRRAIEREARCSEAVLVLEPALGPDGRLKTARKGTASAEIVVIGRAAHAGIEPQKGVNAAHELALQIARAAKLADPRRGLTVQATLVSGGSAPNVVPALARAQFDIRFARASDAKRLERKLHTLRPVLRGARLEVRFAVNRPPLERTHAVQGLFHHAQALMQEIGGTLGEASTGGASDGNFTAALGVPTLDGLGGVGDGAHSPREHVVIRALPARAALLADLLASL